MPAYRGILRRVGRKDGDMIVNANANSAVGNVRVGGKISIIEVGDTTLRDVGCNNDIYDLMDVGRDVTLYVHNHFFRKPIVIGIKHMDTGRTTMMRMGSLIANAMSYLLIYPLLFVVAGFAIGLMGGKDGGFMGMLGIGVVFAGFALSVLMAVMLVKTYVVSRAT